MELDSVAPLFPKEKSLGTLLRDLKIEKLIYGDTDGIFALDWGYMDLFEIDRIVKNRAFTDDADDTYRLRCRSKNNKYEVPRLSVSTDQEYVFLSARYCPERDQFLILVEVEDAEKSLRRYEQSVPYFRNLFNLDR